MEKLIQLREQKILITEEYDSLRICKHIFFSDPQGNPKKIKRDCKLSHGGTTTLTRHYSRRTETRTDNKGFKEMAGDMKSNYRTSNKVW